MEPIRTLIVDDHEVVRKGIMLIAGTIPAIEVVGEAENGRAAVQKVNDLQPDVVLMDLVMPHQDGVSATAEIKRAYPDVKVIVLTTFEDTDRIGAAMEAGADGCLLKDADGEALMQAIQAVQRGDMPLHPRVARQIFSGSPDHVGSDRSDRLTPREKEVLLLVARGMSNKEIAEDLYLTEGTVKVHVSNILSKLDASSRTEAAVWAARIGLVAQGKEQ